MMLKESLHELIESKLLKLRLAIRELERQTIPHTPLPFPRFFKLLDEKLVWPARFNNLCSIKIDNQDSFFLITPDLIEDICKACEYKPSKILKVIRRIEAAAEWCRKRAEGRKRAAEEILKQQRKAADALAALYTANRPTNPAPVFSEELALRVVTSKLQELSEVVKSLLCRPMLCIPMSEYTPLHIAPGITWRRYPHGIARLELDPKGYSYEDITDDTQIETIAKVICRRCKYQPALILTAVRCLEEAAEWCRKKL